MGIGIIRVVLAVAVVINHVPDYSGFNFGDGMIAVQTFYIISGFYMALILSEKYGSSSVFLTNRVLRLYPIYFVVLLLSLLVEIVFFVVSGHWDHLSIYSEYVPGMNGLFLLFLILANMFILGQDVMMFLGYDPSIGGPFFTANFRKTSPRVYEFLMIPQAWTIAIELMFYLCAPFLVKWRTRTLVALVLGGFLFRFALREWGLFHDPWSYRFFPLEMALFVSGMVAYRVYAGIWNIFVDRKVGILLTGILILMLSLFNYVDIPYSVKQWGFYGIFFVMLPVIFRSTKDIKWDRVIGELSYPIYIGHILVISVLGYLGVRILTEDKKIYVIAAVTGSAVLSLILMKVIQEPIEKFRRRILAVRGMPR